MWRVFQKIEHISVRTGEGTGQRSRKAKTNTPQQVGDPSGGSREVYLVTNRDRGWEAGGSLTSARG